MVGQAALVRGAGGSPAGWGKPPWSVVQAARLQGGASRLQAGRLHHGPGLVDRPDGGEVIS